MGGIGSILYGEDLPNRGVHAGRLAGRSSNSTSRSGAPSWCTLRRNHITKLQLLSFASYSVIEADVKTVRFHKKMEARVRLDE